eukprot:superscaffoldBa00000222_g2865
MDDPEQPSSSMVEKVASTKFLSVNLTEDFTWGCHVTSMAKKAHQCLYFLRRLKRVSPNPHPHHRLPLHRRECVDKLHLHMVQARHLSIVNSSCYNGLPTTCSAAVVHGNATLPWWSDVHTQALTGPVGGSPAAVDQASPVIDWSQPPKWSGTNTMSVLVIGTSMVQHVAVQGVQTFCYPGWKQNPCSPAVCEEVFASQPPPCKDCWELAGKVAALRAKLDALKKFLSGEDVAVYDSTISWLYISVVHLLEEHTPQQASEMREERAPCSTPLSYSTWTEVVVRAAATSRWHITAASPPPVAELHAHTNRSTVIVRDSIVKSVSVCSSQLALNVSWELTWLTLMGNYWL